MTVLHHAAVCTRDVESALLGFTDAPRRIAVPGPHGPVGMATVRDPDGVLLELIDAPTPG